MANKTLQRRIEDRKKQAENRELRSKAFKVSKVMGEPHNGILSGHGYLFESKHISIQFSHGDPSGVRGVVSNSSIKVMYREKLVLADDNLVITIYIPGVWERELTRLFLEASRLEKKRQKKEKETLRILTEVGESNLKARFGLR